MRWPLTDHREQVRDGVGCCVLAVTIFPEHHEADCQSEVRAECVHKYRIAHVGHLEKKSVWSLREIKRHALRIWFQPDGATRDRQFRMTVLCCRRDAISKRP